MKKIFLVAATFYAASAAAAVPSGVSSSSSFVHRGSATISGSNFGVKSPAAPYRYDNFENGELNTRLASEGEGGWYTFSYQNKKFAEYSNTVIRRSDTQSAFQDFFYQGNSSCYIGLKFIPAGATRLYASGWFNFEASYTTGGTPSRNAKVMSLQNDADWQTRIDLYPNSIGGHHLYMLKDMASSSTTGAYHNYAPKPHNTLLPDKQWHRLESYMDSDPGGSNASRNLVIDGAEIAGLYGITLLNPGEINDIFIGHYYATDYIEASSDPGTSECFDNKVVNAVTTYNGRYYVCQEDGYWDGGSTIAPVKPWAKRYWDELYVDITPARVEICDSSVKADATHCEIQIPTAWSSNSITVTVNTGTFPPGSTAYLFVINADTEVNATGTEITIGGETSDAGHPDANQADTQADDINQADTQLADRTQLDAEVPDSSVPDQISQDNFTADTAVDDVFVDDAGLPDTLTDAAGLPDSATDGSNDDTGPSVGPGCSCAGASVQPKYFAVFALVFALWRRRR